MFRQRSVALLVALTLGLAVPAPAQQAYTLTDIPPSLTNYPENPASINASGQIVVMPMFLWTPSKPNSASGTLSTLPLPSGATGAIAYALNNLGQVVGYADRWNPGGNHLFWEYCELWQPTTATVNLTAGGIGFGINDAGQAVGALTTGTNAFLWTNGKTYPLPGARGTGINKSGQVTGWGLPAGYGGFLWTPNKPNGTTGTSITLPFIASAINDLGQVVGPPSAILAGATLYTPSGGVQALLTTQSNASGINNHTQVVGMNGNSAYLWDSVHGARDLNDPLQFTINGGSGWYLWQGIGINDYGQIVGWGTNPAGQRRIFLLTPQ